MKSQLNAQNKQIEKKKKEQEDRVNKMVNDVIFPWLKKKSNSVEDAKLMCSVLKAAIQQAVFNKTMKMIVKELDLAKKLKGSDATNIYIELIKLMEKESLTTVYQVLDGLVEEIDLKIRLVNKKITLDELYANN